jgi:hypothetical protein
MVKITLQIITFMLTLTTLFSQESTTRKLDHFNNLIVSDRVIVRLVKDDHESASIETQGIETSAVKTNVQGETLKITIYGEPFTKKKVLVTLHYVELKSIVATGSAEISTTSLLKTDTLYVDLKSGGMVYLDADIGFLSSKVIEGAMLNVKGYATVQDITVATSGTVSAFDLESDIIKVKATTGGKAKIYVEEELDSEAGSKGFISYKGNPLKINRIVNSGGTITAYEP